MGFYLNKIIQILYILSLKTKEVIMKSSIITMVLVVFMTSYVCDACYFTNCPNKWNWGKRSEAKAEETLKQRADANPLLKSYLDKIMMENAPKAPQIAQPPQKTTDYDDIMSYDDVIIEELLKELLEEKSKTEKTLNMK